MLFSTKSWEELGIKGWGIQFFQFFCPCNVHWMNNRKGNSSMLRVLNFS